MSDTSRQFGERPRVELRGAGLDRWADIRALHALAFRHLVGPCIDASECDAFVGRVFAPDYTDTLFTQDLQVAWHDDRPVGTAGWVPADDKGTVARIASVFVSPLFTRTGIGRLLVAAAEAQARSAGFQSFSARAFQPSTGFFEALGYSRSSQGVQAVGTENGIPVIFMRKHGVAGREVVETSAMVDPAGGTLAP